jgi:hypothetical protein
LKNVFKEAGLPEQDVDSVIKNVDFNDNQLINYHEFIAATVEIQQFLTQETLWALF